MVSLALAIATSLGAGYVPIAPGTAGSLAGLLLWALLPYSWSAQIGVVVLLFAAGSWAATLAETHFRRTDPGQVVIDEVMGMLITLTLIPVGWWGAGVGFLLFRVFDVLKPYPVRQLERLPAGIGIMADDAMAGVYANLTLRLALVATARVLG
jgi:phosphatidylglycerophosphatase A